MTSPADTERAPGLPVDDPGLVRILQPDGTVRPSAAAEPYLHLVESLDDAELQDFYRDMVRVRAFDREATNLQRQGQLALWPPSFGQEAAQVGSGRAARSQDHVFPSYREHVVATLRGVDPLDIIRMMRGVTHGGWDPYDPRNGNTHLYSIVLGTQTLHAVGFAMGLAFDGRSGCGDPQRDEAVIVYYGDGASSQGDVHEAMVFAASYDAPAVFFLQNNQWAISVPVTTQSRVPLHGRPVGYGIPSVAVDGNDVLASYAVTRAALDAARGGMGPQAIEAVTYRRGAHTTSDDPTKYRTAQEEEDWARRDPIARLGTFLRSRGHAEDFFTEVDAEAAAYAEDIRVRTLAVPVPERGLMFDHVYSEPHPVVEAQRRWLTEYEADLDGAGS